MTVLEALKATKADLAKIPVRIEDMNSIGMPIHTAVQNLGAIITALEKAEKEDKTKQSPVQPDQSIREPSMSEGD